MYKCYPRINPTLESEKKINTIVLNLVNTVAMGMVNRG